MDMNLAVMWYLIFVLSSVCHEAAHAFLAMKLGDPTAYEGGQVSFNPIPHIRREPFGMIVVPLLTFWFQGWMLGWASAPYDPIWAGRHPKRAAWMSLAGPLANLLLVFLAALLIRIGLHFDFFYAPATLQGFQITAARSAFGNNLATLVGILFLLNLILFVFNMLPVPPLDGSAVLPLLMHDNAAQRYLSFLRQPSFSVVGLIVAWTLFPKLFDPIHIFAINLLYPGADYH